MGVALGLDTQRYYAINIDVRSLANYTILKSQGVHGLTKDLQFLYSFFEPHMVRRMRPEEFLIITKMGSIGAGVFPEVPWHKKEKENIIKAVGLEIEYTRPSETKEAEDRGFYQTVSDLEHARMIALRVDGLSNEKIAKELKRSSATPQKHREIHNNSILRSGYCPKCRRVNGEYAEIKVS